MTIDGAEIISSRQADGGLRVAEVERIQVYTFPALRLYRRWRMPRHDCFKILDIALLFVRWLSCYRWWRFSSLHRSLGEKYYFGWRLCEHLQAADGVDVSRASLRSLRDDELRFGRFYYRRICQHWALPEMINVMATISKMSEMIWYLLSE